MIIRRAHNVTATGPASERNGKNVDRYILMYAEDMEYMAAHALKYGTTETGGALFGLRTHGESIVIMLALGPGPKAIRGGAHFTDDPDYIKKASEYLFEQYALQYVGNHHSHHCMNLRSPSGVDCEQIQRLATLNNYTQLVQLIITYENGFHSSGNFYHAHTKLKSECMSKVSSVCNDMPIESTGERNDLQLSLVRINAYYYAEAHTGTYITSKIRLLEGINPIRSSHSINKFIKCTDVGENISFPLDRIIFDQYGAYPDGQISPQVPQVIVDKLKALPENILIKSELTLDNGFLTIKFTLRGRQILTVIYSIEDKCTIRKAFVTSLGEDNRRHITHRLVKPLISDDLPSIYKWAQRVVGGNNRDTDINGNYEWNV